MRWFPIGLVAVVVLAGCVPEVAGETVAARRFGEFQDALFRRDRRALKGLVCADARAAISGLCRAPLEGRKRLVVTNVTRDRHEYRVHVEDPNAGGTRDAFYVLTKEDGHMRVDLLTTMRYLARRTATRRLVPGKLSPGQIARARSRLAAPPAGR